MSDLIDLENGFAFEDKSGRREFRDGQVTNLRLSYISMHSQGVLTGRVRTLDISLKDEPKPFEFAELVEVCLLYTSPSPRDATLSRMPSSA